MNALEALETPGLSWADRVAKAAYITAQQDDAPSGDEFAVRHMFKDDWYVREFSLPAGMLFIGRVHRHGHIVKLLKGSVWLIMENDRKVFEAPAVLQTQAGFQTVCFCYTDITAQSWHFNPEGWRDIDALEAEHFGAPGPVLARGEQLVKEAVWSE